MMKIVDRQTFLRMPAGTLFAKYEPINFEPPAIKGDTIGTNDFAVQYLDTIDVDCGDDMIDALERARLTGASVALDLDCEGRDGCFDADQLFAIWEPADVRQLISRLERTLPFDPKAERG